MSTEKGKAIVAIDIEGENLDDAADALVEELKAKGYASAEVEEVMEAGDAAAQAADAEEEEEEEPATGDDPNK
jgi:hypothetical protein